MRVQDADQHRHRRALCLVFLLQGAIGVARLSQAPWAFGDRDFVGAGLRLRALRCFAAAEDAGTLRLSFPGLRVQAARLDAGVVGAEALAAVLHERLRAAGAAPGDAGAVTDSAQRGGAPFMEIEGGGQRWVVVAGELPGGHRQRSYARAAGAEVLALDYVVDPAEPALDPPPEVFALVSSVTRE